MSDIVDLDEHKTVDQLKKELLSLRRENKAALKTIEKLLKDLQKKDTEINSLQTMLSKSVPVVTESKPGNKEQAITAEEEIAKLQLERLRTAAKTRSLTLEETRMYDLLVKNKRIATDEPTKINKGSYRELDVVELVKIAEKSKAPDESN